MVARKGEGFSKTIIALNYFRKILHLKSLTGFLMFQHCSGAQPSEEGGRVLPDLNNFSLP